MLQNCQLWMIRTLCTQPTFTSKQLYKHLIRECSKLPKEAQQYYKHTIKQSFKQHVSETDPERINEIIFRATEDAKWVLKKYSGKLDKT